MILKTSVIRFTLKNLRCELLSFFDIMPGFGKGGSYFNFATSSYVQNEKEEWKEKKILGTRIFRKRLDKGAFNNLTRN